MRINTKQLLPEAVDTRKKVINIDSIVNSGKKKQFCTFSANDVNMSTETEKGGHIMVNLSEGMSTSQVAELIGVSERTVRNICKSKQLVHYKVGTKIVILPEDLANYIKSLKIDKEN